MPGDFTQFTWNERVIDDCRHLIRLAVREDLDREFDWTTVSLVPPNKQATVKVVSRETGVIVGLLVAELVCSEMNLRATWEDLVKDGDLVEPGQILAHLTGDVRDLLTAERTILNFIGRLSGIATLTQKFVEAIHGTNARLYDTRKTAPGWRRLEKYAVHCGGGHNHRTGLFDAILIKDNHLAFGASGNESSRFTPTEAVMAAKQFVTLQRASGDLQRELLIEIELDRLDHFEDVLAAAPDIVLLDNMTTDQLREAVVRRNELEVTTELEASGGVRLETIRAIAETGVDRISCGALTHSAINFDVGLDWGR